ncbi:hypothetical protein CVP05_07290 [Conservatibacter flavescens]|uniref:Transposase n=1 Tax=Conservatibacter flavescens TaxID=28161 RepID=A0A2M8S1P9_9PAST|nr:hypothetical protein CVP05_07290 [Conservatibacter flavescens]
MIAHPLIKMILIIIINYILIKRKETNFDVINEIIAVMLEIIDIRKGVLTKVRSKNREFLTALLSERGH